MARYVVKTPTEHHPCETARDVAAALVRYRESHPDDLLFADVLIEDHEVSSWAGGPRLCAPNEFLV